jgi:hypothetical protein
MLRQRVSLGPTRGEQLDTFEESVEREAGFAGGRDPGERAVLKAAIDRVDRFTASLEPRAGHPALFFLHVMLPHSPWRFHQDGTRYGAPSLYTDGYPFSGANDEGEWIAAVTEQRHLLQAQYADQVVGDILDELRTRGLYDDSLVIVAADHGFSFELGTNGRSLDGTLDGIDGLAYAPLFVKRPHQTDGVVDDSNMLSYDLVPTVADALGIDVPFEVEGYPAGSDGIARRGEDKVFFDIAGGFLDPVVNRGVVEYRDEHLPTAADRWIPPIAEGDEPLAGLYERFGLRDLVGSDLDELNPSGRAGAEIPRLDEFRSTASPPVGLLTGRVTGSGATGVVVAAERDRIVAASPLHSFHGEPQTFTLLFPAGVDNTAVRFALVSGNDVTMLDPGGGTG